MRKPVGQIVGSLNRSEARAWLDTASLSELREYIKHERSNHPLMEFAKTEFAAKASAATQEEEKLRHDEVMRMAGGANHIAKWAIVIAILALIVAVVQTFWH